MNFPSKRIEEAVNEFSRLPGIGKKTAMRLVFHLLAQPKEMAKQFGGKIIEMREKIMFCSMCHNPSDHKICSICGDNARNKEQVCVVENFRDLMAIETTQHFRGLYHVLGGIISPVDGIGPEDLNINSLIKRVESGEAKELIMALSPTIEGDTTIYYISKKLKSVSVNITTISRGIAFGSELEYTDETTLAHSIANRLPYENYLVNRQ